MIKFLIFMALLAAFCKTPTVKKKQTWIEKKSFAKGFDYPNNQLDYSIYDEVK